MNGHGTVKIQEEFVRLYRSKKKIVAVNEEGAWARYSSPRSSCLVSGQGYPSTKVASLVPKPLSNL